jgi:hypothetical protein
LPSLSASETVAVDTPANSAMSLRVVIFDGSPS